MNTEKLDVKKGIERLARVFCWPNDPTIADKDKYEFKALCEFVLFKQFVMIPFFKSLLKYLFKHIARLYQYVASLHIENAHMLTYKEAYLFMRDLGVDKVKLILEQVSCPSNVYNGIIRSLEEENYDLFFSALDKSDHTKMMQVLWMMRYLLLGEKGNWDNIDPATPHLTLLPYLPRWITMHDYYYRPYFEIHEYDGEDIFIDERVIEIVDGRLRKKKRTAKNPSPINNRSDNFEEDNKKELDRLFEESLFKSQWKDLLTEYSDNGNLPPGKSWVNRSYIEDTARLVLTHNVILHKDEVMEKYGIDSSEMYNEFINSEVYIYESEDCKDFGRYILFFTREMLYIYNMVENILDDDSKKELQSIIYRSRYTKRLGSIIKDSKGDCQFKESGEDYDRIIKQWKTSHSNGEHLTFQPFSKLSDSEIDMLLDSLKANNVISCRTTNANSRDIFKGKANKLCEEFEPLVWIKRNSKNNKTSKVSVINFLWLLGVNDDDITIDRLNNCFVCPDGDTFVPFKSKNLKNKNGERCKMSEYHGELRAIVESALKDNRTVIARLKKLTQSEKE